MDFMVCYDGSPSSRRAVRLAREHAAVWKAGMIVVKAVERDKPLRRATVEKEEKTLEDEVAVLLNEGPVQYECQLFIGSKGSGEQLVEYARSEGVDQIFIGVERRSKVGKLIFGSTAQYVILKAGCPVVTVNMNPA